MISNVLVCIFRNGDGIHASSSIRLVQTLLRFCIVEICRLILECILKCGYVIHHFNVHFSLCFFADDLLLDVYPVFILNYGSDARQKANSSNFLGSKWVVKQWRQLKTSTVHWPSYCQQTYSAVVVQDVLQRK